MTVNSCLNQVIIKSRLDLSMDECQELKVQRIAAFKRLQKMFMFGVIVSLNQTGSTNVGVTLIPNYLVRWKVNISKQH